MAPLAEAFIRLRPDMTGFKSETERGVAGAGLGRAGDQQGRQFGQQFGSQAGKTAGESLSSQFASTMRRLGPGLLASAGLFGAKELFDKVVGGASDLNETISKSNVVFGELAGKVQAAFADAPRTMGETSQAANEVAATFGNLLVSMGLSQKQAADMSVTMTRLGGDLASFNNVPVDDALEAIRSGLVGETEPLRRFGVNLSDAALRAETMRLGLGEIGATLTAQQRTQAAYSLILAQTTTAQGDFARTSTGAANQQRVLGAQLEQTATNVGRFVLPAYTELVKTVNDIGPGTILAAAGVAVLSNRFAAAAPGVSIFKDLRAAQDLYTQSVAAGTGRVTAALDVSRAGLVGVRAAASSLVGLFGGPWGLALTAATVGIGLMSQKMAENRANAQAAVDAYVRFGEAARQATTTDEVANLIKHDEAVQKLIRDVDRYGLSARTVVDALSGEKEANEAVSRALAQRRAELVRTMQEHTVAAGKTGQVMDDEAQAAASEVKQIDNLSQQFDKAAKKQTNATDAASRYADVSRESRAATVLQAQAAAEAAHQSDLLHRAVAGLGDSYEPLMSIVTALTDTTSKGKDVNDDYGNALKGVASSAIPATTALTQYAIIADSVNKSNQNAAQKASVYSQLLSDLGHAATAGTPVFDTLTRVFSDVSDAELSASDKANLLRQTWEALYQPAINQTDAAEAFNLSLNTLGDSLDKSSRSLDINNAAGIRNRDTVEDLIKRNNDLYFANVAAGQSAEEAGRKHDENARLIEEAGVKAGLSRDLIHQLNVTYGQVPAHVTTQVSATGVEQVLRQLEDMYIAQQVLKEGISVEEATRRYASHGQSPSEVFRGHAAGGPIVGPGTGTSDSIRAWLSHGEHVWTAREVAAAGGHAAVEAIRAQVLHGRSPQVKYPGDGSSGIAFAGGGPVNVLLPFPVTAARTKIPTIPHFAEILGAQQFVRAQAGKPYIWAAAGPGGYDCSGIVSAVWNLLHGRGPYSHTFSTGNEAGYFPIPGYSDLFTAGWSNPGDGGAGGGIGDVGHTAGRIGGLMFESRGGDGVVVGSGVTPLSAFAHIGHYGDGGWVPGPAGVAQPAIVHGGERVLSAGEVAEGIRIHPRDIASLADSIGRAILAGIGASQNAAARTSGLYLRTP